MELKISFKNGNTRTIKPSDYPLMVRRQKTEFFISQDSNETAIIDGTFCVLEEFKTNSIERVEWING